MDLTSSSISLHPFVDRVSGVKMVNAFASKVGMPFSVRGPGDRVPNKYGWRVNYARLVEAGRRTPHLSLFAKSAQSVLVSSLKKSRPDPGWSIWPGNEPLLHAYATSKILYGLGEEGVKELNQGHLEIAVSFLFNQTEEFCKPGSPAPPLMPLLCFQCLHELKKTTAELTLRVAHWADRQLYLAEAHLSKGRMPPLPPNYILLALGALLRAMPSAIDESRMERLLLLLSEMAVPLPAYSRGGLIRLGVKKNVVGASAVDVLIYLLEMPEARAALLNKCEPLLSATFDWLALRSRQTSAGVELYGTDLFHDSRDIDLWFNCAIVDLMHAYKSGISALNRNRLLLDFGAKPKEKAYDWKELKIGGFPWPVELEKRLLRPAMEMISHGQKLEQNGVILFGPPGTSKTSVVESIAKVLGNWPIVRIGPGELLQEGPDRVFAMIDQVFQRLTRLSEAVVLFDEFELLVLERKESTQNASWITGLITNVMLPWFKALHDWGENLYIIATNDIELIDGAIRRAGRFDFVLPVGPPSVSERLLLLESELGGAGWDCKALSCEIDDRATIGEIRQWAQEVKASNLNTDSAKDFWRAKFSESLQIDEPTYDDFRINTTARTFPPSMK